MKTIIPGRAEEDLREAARRFREARYPVALTGAGISVESGIPDFRSPGGLWTIFPPEEYATLSAFRRDPERAWRLYRALGEILRGKQPNAAHIALAALGSAGLLRLIVTQNIDGLHQAAGSRRVIEIHGNHRHLQCLSCGHLEAVREELFAGDALPRCPLCTTPLKPNVVLFEEPVRGMDEINAAIRRSDLLLVVGTSALVHPAAGIPQVVQRRGGRLYEFNLGETVLTPDYFFRGPASATLPLFARTVLGGS